MLCPLLVPLDDAEALDAALRAGADALVLDLSDAAAPGDRAARRRSAAAVLGRLASGGAAPARPPALVRVAPLASGLVDGDLDAVLVGAPAAVLLPGAVGARDLGHLAAKLAVHEAEHGRPAGRTGLVAAVADTAAGVLALAGLPGATARLRALAWDPAALAADLGVAPGASPVRAARDLLLLAARACGVPALDLATAGDRSAQDPDAARRDGFAGRLAFRPADVAPIRAAFRRRA